MRRLTSGRITLIDKALSGFPNLQSANLIFNDQVSNDFSCLSRTIGQNMSHLSRNGKLRIYPTMIPVSFLEQVVADGTIDIGICMSSLHWLEPETPGIGYRYLPDPVVAEEIALRDLKHFLSCRSREICIGGSLVLGISSEGHSSIKSSLECLSMAIDDLEKEGRIPPSAGAKCRKPVHFRTNEEIARAVKEEGSWEIVQSFDKDFPLGPQASLDQNKVSDASWEIVIREVCSSIIGSAGNSILSTIRGEAEASNIEGHKPNKSLEKENEKALLQDLASRFIHHFKQTVSRGTSVGGHWSYLRLERRAKVE